MKRKLTPTSTKYGLVFWIIYFVCMIVIMFVPKPIDLVTKIFMFFIMTLITLHFWARSDYFDLLESKYGGG